MQSHGGSTALWVRAYRNLELAADEYRKYQRWTGEIEDGGEEYADGCPEIAAQMREAAAQLERLARFWESRKP